jgi:hypothetical protein
MTRPFCGYSITTILTTFRAHSKDSHRRMLRASRPGTRGDGLFDIVRCEHAARIARAADSVRTRLILRSGPTSASACTFTRCSPASRRMRRPVALMLRDAAHASRVYPTCALTPPISGKPGIGVRLLSMRAVSARHSRGHGQSKSPSRSRERNVLQGEVVPAPCYFPVPPCYCRRLGRGKATALPAISSFVPGS